MWSMIICLQLSRIKIASNWLCGKCAQKDLSQEGFRPFLKLFFSIILIIWSRWSGPVRSSSLTHFCIGEGEQKGVIYNQVFSSFDKGVAIHVGERNIFCLTSPLIIIFQAEFLKLQLSPTISTLDTHIYVYTQWSKISRWMLSILNILWQFFTS